jgi:hypothetical protein
MKIQVGFIVAGDIKEPQSAFFLWKGIRYLGYPNSYTHYAAFQNVTLYVY